MTPATHCHRQRTTDRRHINQYNKCPSCTNPYNTLAPHRCTLPFFHLHTNRRASGRRAPS